MKEKVLKLSDIKSLQGNDRIVRDILVLIEREKIKVYEVKTK